MHLHNPMVLFKKNQTAKIKIIIRIYEPLLT